MPCWPWRFLLVLVFITGIRGDQPSLKISPNGGSVSKKIGESLAVTCKPNVQDPNLVSQMEWRDPKNRRIESINRANPIYVKELPGEPGLVLFITKLTQELAGQYTCLANYAVSEQIKAVANISTFIDITFVDAPESQYPRVGQDYLVRCKVEGTPSPSVDWTKNEEVITSKDRYVVDQMGLLIRNVKESDDGVYKCMAVVISTGHFQSRNIKVEVIVPPAIKPMKEVTVIEGETASTKCLATGKPPPTYTWIKLPTSEDLSKTDRFDVRKNTGDLIINRVEFNDNAVYKCVAENQAGRAEQEVKINVRVKPKIYELLNVTATVGHETKIICKAKGFPTPRITFRKLSKKEPYKQGEQVEDRRLIIEHESFDEKGETFGSLVILKLNRSDDGLYECIAENEAGTSYKNGHITVEFPPTFERTRTLPPAWAWNQKVGNITCIPEAIPNATVIWKYNGLEIGSDSANFVKQGNGPISHLIVKSTGDHRFYTNYECIASNKHGTSRILLPLKEAKIPGVIIQIKPQTITATTVKFNIEPPPHFEGLPIKSFSVQYRQERDMSWDYALNHTWSFQAPYILENLRPEVTYHFRFAARNDVGLGPWTNAQPITMPRRSEPAEPKIFIPSHTYMDSNSGSGQQHFDRVIASPYSDHFELRWNVPNDNGDPIDSYLIRYCITRKINGEWRDSDCSGEIRQSLEYTSYELNDLRPNTIYKIELRAHNAIGASSPAQIKMKTAQGMDPIVPYNEPAITSSAIIGLIVAAIIIALILVDLVCFCTMRAGILAFFCNRTKTKHQEEDPRLGREEREPLRMDSHHVNGEHPMSVEFSGGKVYSKPGEIIGKHSAV